jgi:hypothetical protein
MTDRFGLEGRDNITAMFRSARSTMRSRSPPNQGDESTHTGFESKPPK